MSLLSNLLLVASLAALSLAACTGENKCSSDECLSETEAETEPSSSLDLIRIVVEADGAGTVVVEGDETVRCTGDQRFCSFLYVRGTDLVVYAEDSSTGGFQLQDGCEGVAPCSINLDSDQVVVASFHEGMRPTIIVEPIPSWYRDYAQRTIEPATVASAE